MKMIYGRQDMPTFERAQENCYLLTNGLGGYSSLSAAFSMPRGDQGLLVAARTAPNDRVNLVARMQETLWMDNTVYYTLSTQEFADDTPNENGWKHLSSCVVEASPRWTYDVGGVRVTREVGMAWEQNASAVVYGIENRTDKPCRLDLHPWVLGFEKGHAPEKKWAVSIKDGCITTNGMQVYVKTNGALMAEKPVFSMQHYMHDEPDGRPEKGLVANVCVISLTVQPGETKQLWVTFADTEAAPSAQEMLDAPKYRRAELCRASGLKDEVAQQLVWAADAYIAQRASTGGKTILAGYPFFGDWGRDTMISLPGCCLSAKRYEDAKSILRTFLQYEKDGLVPNLFPEGESDPMYNTVDAALLLFSGVYEYVRKSGDEAFIAEAWPVLERIVSAYKKGTHFGIYMDKDGLICAGQGLDQVTWMDVRVGEILPTPRHGKPVEINAYWYSALRIMAEFAAKLGKDGAAYNALAEQVKAAFVDAFWMADKQYLKDVISGTEVDTQLRCNQIWAVTQPFTMLTAEQEKAVVDTVYAHLYTPCGLRTLSPEDAQYHPIYAGPMVERDMAYHQGTTWVFPLGAYYLAYLKVHGNTAEAIQAIRDALTPMAATLREGCIGQLPEIYNGDAPAVSRGCFAQAWSVGEILRVYEAIEAIENKEEATC